MAVYIPSIPEIPHGRATDNQGSPTSHTMGELDQVAAVIQTIERAGTHRA